MTLESFQFIIEKLQDSHSKSNSIYSLGVDLTEIEDSYHQIINHFLKVYYGEEGEEWISWFLYEKSFNADLQAKDSEGNDICYDIPSLWKCVEEIRVSNDFKEYSYKKEKESLEERISEIYDKLKDGIR